MTNDFCIPITDKEVETAEWGSQCQCGDSTSMYKLNGDGKWEVPISSICNGIRDAEYYPITVMFESSETIKDRKCGALKSSPFFCKGFWPVIRDDLNGSFDCKYTLDEEGEVVNHVSWSCFKIKHVEKKPPSPEVHYKWLQVAVFVRFQPKTGRQTVFFLDLPDGLEENIRDSLHSACRDNPYIWHTMLTEQVKQLYDATVWAVRDLVREVEKARNRTPPPIPDFPNLHDMARHISHVNEILEVAKHTVQRIIQEQNIWRREYITLSKKDRLRWVQNHQDLLFVAKEIHSLKTRSRSLGDRMQNEINLAFNLVSQNLGRNAQGDNAMMKTIAIVSLVYLPGSFVSGLFGTNFFNLNKNGSDQVWTVSHNFWLYWVITIPLTFATLTVWAIWHSVSSSTRPFKKARFGIDLPMQR